MPFSKVGIQERKAERQSLSTATDGKYKGGDHIPGMNVGGWYGAGDFDLEEPAQLSLIQSLALGYREFNLKYDSRKVDTDPYFCNHRNMVTAQAKKSAEQITRYADMFSAMGTEARLRIMQLLLSAHPEGLVVGEIQEELVLCPISKWY